MESDAYTVISRSHATFTVEHHFVAESPCFKIMSKLSFEVMDATKYVYMPSGMGDDIYL